MYTAYQEWHGSTAYIRLPLLQLTAAEKSKCNEVYTRMGTMSTELHMVPQQWTATACSKHDLTKACSCLLASVNYVHARSKLSSPV